MRQQGCGDTAMICKAKEDFTNRTLASLPTLLEKLAYICSLQTSEGAYQHWGLSRVFGEGQAQKAIGSAHAETAAQLTHTPVREIYKEFQDAMEKPLSAEVSPHHIVILSEFQGPLRLVSPTPTGSPRIATVRDIGAMIPDFVRVIRREGDCHQLG